MQRRESKIMIESFIEAMHCCLLHIYLHTLRLNCSTTTENNIFPVNFVIGIKSDEAFGDNEEPAREKISAE